MIGLLAPLPSIARWTSTHASLTARTSVVAARLPAKWWRSTYMLSKKRRVRRQAACSAVSMARLGSAARVAASGPEIVMEEFKVPAADPGIALYVCNKHPQGISKFTGDKILLFGAAEAAS